MRALLGVCTEMNKKHTPEFKLDARILHWQFFNISFHKFHDNCDFNNPKNLKIQSYPISKSISYEEQLVMSFAFCVQ